jgi:hypothetical protein
MTDDKFVSEPKLRSHSHAAWRSEGFRLTEEALSRQVEVAREEEDEEHLGWASLPRDPAPSLVE